MKKPLCAFSLALLLASAPAAFAQTGAVPGGSAGGTPAGTQMRPDADPSIRERMGPRQRPMELVQTTLLNRFGGLGFHRIVDIRREGANYVATVETVQGDDLLLTIDPQSGRILSERPANAGEIASTGTAGTAATAGTVGVTGGALAGSGMSHGGAAAGPMNGPVRQPPGSAMTAPAPVQGGQMASVGCSPADWSPLESAIGRLPQDRKAAAQRMLMDVYDRHAANDTLACRGRVEDLRSYLRASNALP